MDADAPCESLPWDSAFFGRRIARVTGSRLDRERARRVAAWAEQQRVDCLYFLAEADDLASARCAEALGFRITDVRLTIARPLEGRGLGLPPEPAGVRPAREADLPELRAIARTSHRDSRFYADPRLADERCDALYERWIEEKLHGAADVVLVAEGDEGPEGYLSCLLRPDGAGQLDLLAVAPEARGRGRGGALTAASLRWFAASGRQRALLVTQGRNRGALGLFGSFGFTTERTQIWYHWWPREPEAPPDASAAA